MKDSFQVKLSSALLEEVFETLTEEVHDHDVVHLTILSLLVANKVELRYVCLCSKLVNQLAFPEKHDVALHFYSFFLHT